MRLYQKIKRLINKELSTNQDKIDSLCNIQSSLTLVLAEVISKLHKSNINYPIEKVYLDIKRTYEAINK
jgi:hypothetical protein